MEAFRRLRKKAKDSQEALSGATGKEEQEASGFICPACMVNLSSPEMLQAHWNAVHNAPIPAEAPPVEAPPVEEMLVTSVEPSLMDAPVPSIHTENRDGDVLALRQEVDDLRVSLKEEKWYAEELKKDLGKIKRGEMPSQVTADIEDLKNELRKSEETRSLLSSEIMLLRQDLKDTRDNANAYRQVKDAMEQKAAQLAGDMATFKAQLDEEKGHRSSVEETLRQTQHELRERDSQVSALESQLMARPDGDDVLLLKRELVTIQTVMDQLSQEREVEKEELERKCKGLEEEVSNSAATVKDLRLQLASAPRKEEIERLEASVNNSSASGQFFQEQLQTLQAQNKQLQDQIIEKQTKLHECELECQKMEQELNFSKEQQEQNVSSKDEQLQTLQKKVDKLKRDKESKEKEMQELRETLTNQRTASEEQLRQQEQDIGSSRREVTRMEEFVKEKEAQIQDLESQLTSLQSQLQEEKTNSDEFQAQLWEKQAQIQEQERILSERSNTVTEMETLLKKEKEETDRLEAEKADLFAKIEAGEGADTAIQQLKHENETLESELEAEQNAKQSQAEEFKLKIADLHKQLQEVRGLLEAETARLHRSEENLKDTTEKLSSSQEKCARLDAEVKVKVELLSTQEATLTNQKADFESHLRTSQATLEEKQKEASRVQEQLQQVNEELGHSREQSALLEKEKRELKESLTSTHHECAKLKTDIKNMDNKISTLESEKAALKTDLEAQIDKLQKEQEKSEKTSGELLSVQGSLSGTKTLLEETQKQLEEEKRHKEQTQRELSEVQSQLNANIIKLGNLEAEHDRVKSENAKAFESLQMQKNEVDEKLVSDRASLQKRIDDLSSEKSSLQDSLNNTQNTLQLREKELSDVQHLYQQEQAKFSEKVQREKQLVENIAELEQSKISLSNELRQEKVMSSALRHKNQEHEESVKKQTSQIADQSKQIENKEKVQKNMQKKIEILEQEVAKPCEQCTNYESQVVKLQTSLTNTEEKSSALQTELESLHERLNTTEEDLEKVKGSEASLRGSVEGLQQVKTVLDARVAELDEQQREAEQFLQNLKNKQETLQRDLEQEKENTKNLTDTRDAFQEELDETKQCLATERQQRSEEVSSLQEARQLLISQKLELQSQLKEKDTDIAKAVAEHEESNEVAKKVQNMLNEKAAALQNKLTAEVQAKEDVIKEKEELEQRFSMQFSALNENLGTLREEIMKSESRNKELEKNVDNIKGEMHVMEATLQNNQDERRALLERCLGSENRVAELQEKNAELRKQVEDAQAAMHELGRENQNLQIRQTKSQARKWIEDKDVYNCMDCQKAFSVTIRKHHCRNCGDIFCNDCSAKQATVASSKKPVRVCEACYAELTK